MALKPITKINNFKYTRFDTLTVVLLQIQVLWDVKLCTWASSFQYLHGHEVMGYDKLSDSIMVQLMSSLSWYNVKNSLVVYYKCFRARSLGPRDAILQNTENYLTNRSSHPTSLEPPTSNLFYEIRAITRLHYLVTKIKICVMQLTMQWQGRSCSLAQTAESHH